MEHKQASEKIPIWRENRQTEHATLDPVAPDAYSANPSSHYSQTVVYNHRNERIEELMARRKQHSKTKQDSDYDGAWKEFGRKHFRAIVEVYFPELNWLHGDLKP